MYNRIQALILLFCIMIVIRRRMNGQEKKKINKRKWKIKESISCRWSCNGFTRFVSRLVTKKLKRYKYAELKMGMNGNRRKECSFCAMYQATTEKKWECERPTDQTAWRNSNCVDIVTSEFVFFYFISSPSFCRIDSRSSRWTTNNTKFSEKNVRMKSIWKIELLCILQGAHPSTHIKSSMVDVWNDRANSPPYLDCHIQIYFQLLLSRRLSLDLCNNSVQTCDSYAMQTNNGLAKNVTRDALSVHSLAIVLTCGGVTTA